MTQALAAGLSEGAVYSLVAVGLVLSYSVSGTINLAHGEYVVLSILLTGSLAPSIGLLPAALVAILAIAALGAATERFLLRRAGSSSPTSRLLLTLGLAFALAGLMRLGWGPDERTVDPLVSSSSVEVIGAFINPQSFWLWGVLILAVAGITTVLRRSFAGRTVVACAENPLGARLCGVSVNTISVMTFAAAAALAALAGVLYGPLTFVTYESGVPFVLRGLIAGALGGLRSIPAAVLGGLFLGLSESLSVTYLSSQLKTPIAFGILLGLLALRPSGFTRAGAAA